MSIYGNIMIRIFKNFLSEVIYIFTNYIVSNIPIWYVRRFFYRIMGMKIGANSRILMKTVVVSPWKIKIGNNSIINEYCHLDG